MKLTKKNNHRIKSFLLLFLVVFIQQIQAQTTVTSLEELLPYLKVDNSNIKLEPGTYSITSADITANKFSNPLFLFEGSNSTYDFTGVTINIDTEVLTAFGSVDVNQMQLLGNNIVLQNLTMVDIGTTAPTKRAQSIVMDGADNRIEGFHLTIRGSYPYGYGDAFGKGGGPVISHRKHSGILIRGLRNHLKNTNIISRSYGHIVFMQAASYPTIEGCYIEGEMRSTDDMLAETSGPAFNVGFMTVWGYKLPSGYTMSLQEAGVRAYNAGTTYIDGVEIKRGTDNPTILNTTIKNARTGVTLSHASGTKYVENCVAIGCEQGFAIGSGKIVNCSADAQYGAVYGTAYSSDSGTVADITILPSDTDSNGSRQLAYIGGKNHDLTFRSSETNPDQTMFLKMSGVNYAIRSIESTGSTSRLTSNNIKINNLSSFPLIMEPDATGNTGASCGPITDNGTNNLILPCGVTPVFPDANATYYINNPRWTVKLSADGGEQINLAGDAEFSANTQWKITPSGEEGYYFIDGVGGGDNARITNVGTLYPHMEPSTINEERSRWKFEEYSEGLFFITSEDDARLRVNSDEVDLVTSGSSGSYTRFSFSLASYTLGTETNTIAGDISLYPIPSADILNVKMKVFTPAKINILNMMGKVVLSNKITSSINEVDLSSLLPGVYIASVISENGGIYTQKIIKL